MAEPVLSADGLSKSFGVVRALSDVSLEVRAGEVTALVGENGAGKSTLLRLIEGIHAPDSGGIRLSGTPVRFAGPREALAAGIRVIHQEPEIIPDVSVAENLFPGDLPRHLGLIMDRRRLLAQTRALLERFAMERELSPTQLCAGLGPAQRQMIEIMRAVHAGGRVIAFDEPTSSLTGEETRRLFTIIRRMRDEGVAVIYISHRLAEVTELADRVAVLRDGRLVSEGPVSEESEQSITRKMVGRELSDMFPPRTPDPGEVVLSVRGLSTAHVRDISFELRAGEVLGIGGLVGAGRSELAKGLFGFHQRLAGEITLAGAALPPNSPGAAIMGGLGFAPEDRKDEALLLMRSILDNAALCIPDKVSRFGLFDRRRAEAIVGRISERLAIKAPSLDTLTANLSGGNQQKVVLARWLARAPRVLILDEPTRGIDVGAKREIYQLIASLTETGLGLIVISSEMPELLGLADRALVMAEGRITAELAPPDLTEEALLHAAMPASGEAAMEEHSA